jgi:hypothetical protein
MSRFQIFRETLNTEGEVVGSSSLFAGEWIDGLSVYEYIVLANKLNNYTDICYVANIWKDFDKPEYCYYYVFNADGEVMIQPMDIKDDKPVINDENPTATYNEKEVEEILFKFHKGNIAVTVEDGKTESWIEQERRLIETKKWHESENTGKSLQEHLGLTDEEYSKWLSCTVSFKIPETNIFGNKKDASNTLRNIANIISASDNSINFNVINDFSREIISTLKQKNEDYGNSFLKNIERFGDVAMLMPMFNKLDRLESLTKKDYANFESVSDSIRDLIGYALMSLYYVDIIRVNKNKLKGGENGTLE